MFRKVPGQRTLEDVKQFLESLPATATALATVKEIEGKGFGMVATRDIKKGEVVMAEEPFVSFTADAEGKRCENCHTMVWDEKTNKPLPNRIMCPGCGVEAYCSEHCQRVAYESYHVALCKTGYINIKKEIIKNGQSQSSTMIPLLTRLFAMHKVLTGEFDHILFANRKSLEPLPHRVKKHILEQDFMKFTHRSLDREELKEEMIEEDIGGTTNMQSTHDLCMKELGILYANDAHLDVAVIAQIASFILPNTFAIQNNGIFFSILNYYFTIQFMFRKKNVHSRCKRTVSSLLFFQP
jgi:hypothetical protein